MSGNWTGKLALILLLLLAAASPAQIIPGTTTAQEEATPVPAEEPEEDIRLDSPRAAIEVFITHMNAEMKGEQGAWRTAVRAMNTDDLSSIGFDDVARQNAVELYEVFNRIELVDFDTIPENWEDSRYVWKVLRSGAIILERDSKGRWRFTPETIELARDFLAELPNRPREAEIPPVTFRDSPYVWFRDRVPSWLLQRSILLHNYQWLGLFVFILLGLVGDRLIRYFLGRVVRHQLSQREIEFEDDHLTSSTKWLGLAAAGLIWNLGVNVLGLPDHVTVILHIASVTVFILAGVLASYRIVDLVAGVFEKKAQKTLTSYDDILVPLVRASAKVFIATFGIVFIAENLAVDVTSLLAGLGIGGLAFALAAKDTIENLFGSITVLIDRPFNIGDWINVEGMDGSVEEIGLRSTRIRTFYNSQITIPNSNLIKAKVDNYGRRKYRRFKTTIQVTYNTSPEKIEAFCEGIRELIRLHPYTRKDYFHVYLNEFGAHSLDILLYVFFAAPDWATELRERHRLMADIIRLAHRLGVEFAFPTQTLYLERGSGPAQPDDSPFPARREVSRKMVSGRRIAEEIVNTVQDPRRSSYPPPPVDFGAPPLDEEIYPEESRRGGDSEA